MATVVVVMVEHTCVMVIALVSAVLPGLVVLKNTVAVPSTLLTILTVGVE